MTANFWTGSGAAGLEDAERSCAQDTNHALKLKRLPLLSRQRLVWSDSAVVNDLLKKGLFMRIYEPQVI